MTRQARADAGFTLTELLVSLALLALFGTLLEQAIAGRGIGWTRMDRDTVAGEGVAAARQALDDRIARIWPVTNYLNRPPGPDFDGQQTEMAFLAPQPQFEGRGPLRRYRLILDAGGDLVLQSRSDLALDSKLWPERQVLLHGVQGLDIAYYGSWRGMGSQWRAEWRRPVDMPSLVRVRLALNEGDRRRWPDLIVRPQADIDSDCRLLKGSQMCAGR